MSSEKLYHRSSEDLFRRLLSTAYMSGPPDESVFSYEIATVSPAFFQDDGSMRKCQNWKSISLKWAITLFTKELKTLLVECLMAVYCYTTFPGQRLWQWNQCVTLLWLLWCITEYLEFRNNQGSWAEAPSPSTNMSWHYCRRQDTCSRKPDGLSL